MRKRIFAIRKANIRFRIKCNTSYFTVPSDAPCVSTVRRYPRFIDFGHREELFVAGYDIKQPCKRLKQKSFRRRVFKRQTTKPRFSDALCSWFHGHADLHDICIISQKPLCVKQTGGIGGYCQILKRKISNH